MTLVSVGHRRHVIATQSTFAKRCTTEVVHVVSRFRSVELQGALQYSPVCGVQCQLGLITNPVMPAGRPNKLSAAVN